VKPLPPLQRLSKRTAFRSGLVHEYYQAAENGPSPSCNALFSRHAHALQRNAYARSRLTAAQVQVRKRTGVKVIGQCRGGWKQRRIFARSD
jgi:hypothetical protein